MPKIVILGLTALLIVATIAIISGSPFTIMRKIISVAAAQQNTTTATSPNTNTTFYLFTANHDGVNKTKTWIEPDAYSPETLTVNRGDTVVIHFYNIDTTDRHTFTPYVVWEGNAGFYNCNKGQTSGDKWATCTG